MDYEKNNEFLAIVRRMVADGQLSQEVAAKYFPELKESEDERVRKAIISIVTFSPEAMFDRVLVSRDDALAWLDKQGEQKPVAIPKFRVGDFVKDANYHGEPTYEIVGMDGECYICQYRGNKSMGDRSVMHFCFDNPYLRLVEQKPVEDVNGEDYGIDSLWHAHRILKKTLGKVEGYQTDDGILEHECAISAVKKLYEQNPAWSEEDETGLTNTIIMLKEGASLHFNKKDIAKAVNWLKSLKDRYTWKPSDEQMKVLDVAIMNSHLTTAEYDGLVKLREQLKKL